MDFFLHDGNGHRRVQWDVMEKVLYRGATLDNFLMLFWGDFLFDLTVCFEKNESCTLDL